MRHLNQLGRDSRAFETEATFEFIQYTPSQTWTIEHNLNKHPSVTTIESSNVEVKGRVVYDSPNQITVTFNVAFSGKAYLN